MIEIDYVPAAANAVCREKGPDCEGGGGYKRRRKWREGAMMLRIRGRGAGGTVTLVACEKCASAVLDRFKAASKLAKKAAREAAKG